MDVTENVCCKHACSTGRNLLFFLSPCIFYGNNHYMT